MCSFRAALVSSYLPDVTDDERVSKTMDKLSVNFGVEILSLVKGYVSTEVDARLSFDTEATLERAHNIISLYEAAGEAKWAQRRRDVYCRQGWRERERERRERGEREGRE